MTTTLNFSQDISFTLFPGSITGVIQSTTVLPYTTTFSNASFTTTFTVVQPQAPWITNSTTSASTGPSSISSVVKTGASSSTNSSLSSSQSSSAGGSSAGGSSTPSPSSQTTKAYVSSVSTSFIPIVASSTTGGSSSGTLTVTNSSYTGTSTTTHTLSSSVATSRHSHSHSGAIVGAVIGGLIGLIALVGFLLWFRRRQRRPKVAPSAEFMAIAAAMRHSPTPTPDGTFLRDSSVEPDEPPPGQWTGSGAHTPDPLLDKLREAVAQMAHIRGPDGEGGGSEEEKPTGYYFFAE